MIDPARVSPSATAQLVGRAAELELIDDLRRRLAVGDGDALLLTGPPGIGKSALLNVGAARAAAAGMQVLRTTGVEFECDVSFSALSQLIPPVSDQICELTSPARAALRAVLGGIDASVGQQQINHAVVELLRAAGCRTPTLVVADDVGRLDPAQRRRVALGGSSAGTGVGFLGAARSGSGGVFDPAGLPEHKVRPLDDPAAAHLLGLGGPDLHSRVRRRLLEEAEGNPLALIELPRAGPEMIGLGFSGGGGQGGQAFP